MTSNLALIERAIAFACRRYGLDRDHAEEVSSTVKLRLVENNYAILRAYEQRSSFRTYISMVVQRMVLDYENHIWGKWHASAEAKRLGEVAVELEQLLLRDGRTFDEAAATLERKHANVTREALRELARRLPERLPRRREVALDEAAPAAARASESVEHRVIAREQRTLVQRLAPVIAAIIGALPDDERLVFQLHFQGGMKMADIARALQRDQKELYRLKDKRTSEINAALLRAGFSPREVLDLIGSDEIDLEFSFGKPAARPSMTGDETPGDDSEDPQ